jgi:hypothetical protein
MHLRDAPPLPRLLWPDIPRRLEDLLLAMLAKAPAQRPCMRDVLARLDEVAAELIERRDQHRTQAAATPVPASALPPVRHRAARPALQAALGASALALAVLLMCVSQEHEGLAADGAAVATAIAIAPAPARATTPAPPPVPAAAIASPEPPPPPRPVPVPAHATPPVRRPPSQRHAPAASVARAPIPTAAVMPDVPHPARVAMRLAVHREPGPAAAAPVSSSRLVAWRGNTGRGLDPNGTLVPYP